MRLPLVSLLLVSFVIPLYSAEVYLGLQAYGGNGKALGVGLARFQSDSSDPDTPSLTEQIRAVMREDILFTRLFNVTEGGPAPENKLDSLSWGGLGAQVVIGARVKIDGNQVTLECKIYDVSSGKVLWGKQ